MAGACDVCGSADTEPCRYCGRAVCADHERPSAHRCTGPRTAPLAGEESGGPTDAGDPVRTVALVLLAALLLAAAVIGGTALSPAAGGASGHPDEVRLAHLVHELVNEERRERGLHALAWNETLARMAADHSDRMAREDYFGHGPEPLFERYARYGLSCPGGENIYATVAVDVGDERTLARRTVDAWLASPGHREAMLKERFTVQGVGVAVEREDGRATVYVTEDFC